MKEAKDGNDVSYAESKLVGATQAFITLLFDHDTFREAMANLNIGYLQLLLLFPYNKHNEPNSIMNIKIEELLGRKHSQATIIFCIN